MNYVDFIIIALAVVCALVGYSKGAYKSLKWILSIILGILLMPVLQGVITALLMKLGFPSYITLDGEFAFLGSVVAGKVLGLVVFVIIFLIAKALISLLLPAPPCGGTFRVIDGILGIVLRLFLLCVFLWFLNYLLGYSRVDWPLYQSKIYQAIVSFSPFNLMFNWLGNLNFSELIKGVV